MSEFRTRCYHCGDNPEVPLSMFGDVGESLEQANIRVAELESQLAATKAELAEAWAVIDLYAWLEYEAYDLRAEEIRSFDDADVRWQAYSHHMQKPVLRPEGVGGSTPLEAIRSAKRGDAVVDATCKKCGATESAWKQDADDFECQDCYSAQAAREGGE